MVELKDCANEDLEEFQPGVQDPPSENQSEQTIQSMQTAPRLDKEVLNRGTLAQSAI